MGGSWSIGNISILSSRMEISNSEDIKAMIAFDFHKRFKKMYPDMVSDSERDWKYACNVWDHFTSGVKPMSSKWIKDQEDYERYQRYF